MSKLPPHLELGLNELDNAEALGDLEGEKRARKMLDAAGLDPDQVGEHRAARAGDGGDEVELEEVEEVQQTRAEAKAAAAAERAAAKAQDEAPAGRSSKADKMSTADAPTGEQG